MEYKLMPCTEDDAKWIEEQAENCFQRHRAARTRRGRERNAVVRNKLELFGSAGHGSCGRA